MARPRKDVTQDHYVSFRVHEKDHDKIVKKASKSGVSVSEFCRSAALNKRLIERTEIPPVNEECLIMLRAIGNNLNQIARRVNESGYIDNTLGNSFSDRELIMLMTERFRELTQELSGLK